MEKERLGTCWMLARGERELGERRKRERGGRLSYLSGINTTYPLSICIPELKKIVSLLSLRNGH